MGKLIDLSRFKHDFHNPYEYFKEVHWVSYKDRYEFNVTSTYPHEAYVHGPTQEEKDPCFILDLRRFVERRAVGDVVYRYENLGYKWCWNLKDVKHDWDRSYTNISHGYWILNFEEAEDLVLFKLVKPNMITDKMRDFHPDYDDHNKHNTRDW